MAMRRRNLKLMPLAAIFSILAGAGFALIPGHTDLGFRHLIGLVWLVAGVLWILAWRRAARAEPLGR